MHITFLLYRRYHVCELYMYIIYQGFDLDIQMSLSQHVKNINIVSIYTSSKEPFFCVHVFPYTKHQNQDNVQVWWFPSRSPVLIYIYIYVHSLYEFCYRSYIQRECHSVLSKPHHITFCMIISGECAVPGLNATFCFLWFTNCVLLFDKSLILGCLWPLVFVLNNILILGI